MKSLNVIREPDADCEKCGLYKTCDSPIMNGDGPEDATFIFVGEAPGGNEDEEGVPFKGRAGKLLKSAIKEIGINLKDCRFTNAVRCRPPKNNLGDYPKAIEYCRPKIMRELHVLKPKVVIVLGNNAVKSLIPHTKTGITKLNGEVFRLNDRYYVPCVHPAYVLRSEGNEFIEGMLRKALRVAKRLVERKKSEKKLFLHTIRTKQELYEFRDLLVKQKELATDIEGSTLSAFDKRIKPRLGCTGWAWDDTHAVSVPIYSRVGWEKKIEFRPEEGLEMMKEVWEHPDVRHILHFGKYDAGYSQTLYKIKITNYWYDTGLASYALDETKGIHGLKDWAWRVGMGDHELELKQYQAAHPEANPKKGGDMTLVPWDILGPYNMCDCIATWRVKERTFPLLVKRDLYKKPFRFPLMYHNWTAQRAEMNGLKLNLEFNEGLQEKFPRMMDGFEEELKEHSEYKKLHLLRFRQLVHSKYVRVMTYKRRPPNVKRKVMELVDSAMEKKKREKKELVNLGSPDDKRDLIYKFCGYKVRKSTESGLASTKMDTLREALTARKHPVLELIIKRSTYASSYSKYVKPIPEWAGSDGRTHTSYLVHGQVTGRVGSEEPNHENLPKRGEDKEIVTALRTQFTATNDDYILGESDEKQIEMRLFADRAQDDMMIEEFNAGKDPHRMGAAAGFEIPEESVTKDQRTAAKSAISFGLLYGRHAEALAKSFGKSLKWAQQFIDRYFGKYDDCLAYREEVEKYVMKHLNVMSFFGRLRRLPNVESEDFWVRAEALRQAINSPIQGDASDITWCAGYRLEKWLRKYKMRSKVVGLVHDALYVDIYRKEVEDVLEKKFKLMTDRKWLEKMTGHWFTVPLDIDISLGPDLGHMEELKRTGKGFSFEIPERLAA